MIRFLSLPAWLTYLLLAASCITVPPAQAQQSAGDAASPAAVPVVTDSTATAVLSAPAAKLERLAYIQNIVTQKLEERRDLGERIEAANEQDKADLRRQADDLTTDIRQLRTTFESIAIGGVDTSLFETQEASQQSDWRKDITLIAQPVIDSLKDLTEKPRRLKELRDTILLRQQERDAANLALENLTSASSLRPEGELALALDRLIKLWQGRRDDALGAIEIARFQISDLQGDKPISKTVFEALGNFATGRGLTLLIAAMVASAVYFGVRFLLRGYRATLADNSVPESRTRYRLAAYSMQAMTFVLILIAIFVVFYQRGDVLLLGLLILLIVGLALSIRQLLPQYVAEARLLLNIGPMRESERITFRGLPWRVESINMYTVLRNPELHGVLRIPLEQFHGMTSRPSGKDSWFPTSRGDVILLDNDTLLEVIDQNPDTVELKYRGGELLSVPTSEFYGRHMTNLSRGGAFGVTSIFGIDYRHQDSSLNNIPKLFRDAIRDALSHTDLSEFIKDVRVELKEAAASSIDYWIFVNCDSRAAKSYHRISRAIQGACIDTCSRQALDIPYPHVSVVQKAS